MSIPNVTEVIKRSKIPNENVKCIYVFGSQVYGNTSYDSDWDFIIVADNILQGQEIRSGNFNMHLVTEEGFQNLLDEHRPQAIECYFAPQQFKLLEKVKFKFKLSIRELRHSFSQVASNSWVKAKKKLEQGDYYIGIKSLYHSLRIPMFGIQLVKYGEIHDFSCANKINDILISRKDWTWDDLDSNFRKVRNQIMTDFRALTGK